MRAALLAPKYWPTWVALGALRLGHLLPFGLQVMFGSALGCAVSWLPVSHVRIVRRNLELCFPDLDTRARRKLIRRHFASLGVGIFETANVWWCSNERIRSMTEFHGFEHLEQALERGHGVIVIGSHFTTMEMGARILGTAEPLNVLYRRPKNALLEWVLERAYRPHARRAIERDDIRVLIRGLRSNEVVWYAPDQSYRKKGAQMVRFFGVPAPTNTFTTRLARMTDAVVLPYFFERLPGARGYRAEILPALDDYPSDDPIADAERYNQLLEAHIRHVPEQYLWIHRRFKGLTASDPDYYGRDARPLAKRALLGVEGASGDAGAGRAEQK
jgi:KDO2-lipid IV(A) lauroyltransferase